LHACKVSSKTLQQTVRHFCTAAAAAFAPAAAAAAQAWRQHFVLEENMLEVECPAVTPEAVLKASGHVDRFTDFMVTDTKTGDCYRADHLLEAAIEAALEDTKAPLSPEARKVRYFVKNGI
jgi:glycyl-tRNA synthetase (class II)